MTRFIIAGLVLFNANLAVAFDLNNISIGGAVDAFKAATLSSEDARALSLKAIKQYDGQNKVAPADDKYAKRLADLTSKHTEEDGLKLNFKAYLVDEMNAFATADGSIRFFSGLMDKMSDEELLFVIGHEIGHVKLEHSKKKMKTAYATSAARKSVAAAGGDLGSVAASELGGIAESMVNATYSRKEESASDGYGVEFMKKHGYNPTNAVSALKKLAELGDSSSILASHPAPTKRAKAISKKYKL
ncbi:MAG: M48 family metallopeptidase [Gammaproteobacteria bacterium]|nr:M48 family metallopeptidase [Gammaproteobacteria bacterium]